MDESQNRRKFTRVELESRISVVFPGIEQRKRLLVQNISKGGLFIKTEQVKPVGTVLRFEFSVRDGSSPIKGAGIVRWTEEREGEIKGMGIKFTELNDEGRKELSEAIEILKNTPSSGSL